MTPPDANAAGAAVPKPGELPPGFTEADIQITKHTVASFTKLIMECRKLGVKHEIVMSSALIAIASYSFGTDPTVLISPLRVEKKRKNLLRAFETALNTAEKTTREVIERMLGR